MLADYENTDALIWIVDSCDVERMAECRDELHKVLADDGSTYQVF